MANLEPIAATDELVDLIYQGPLERQPWLTFLRVLRAKVGCRNTTIAFKLPKSGNPPPVIADSDSETRSRVDFQEAVRLSASLGHLDPMRNVLDATDDACTLDDAISREELERNEFYHRVMRPSGVEHVVGMRVSEPNGWSFDLGLLNGPGDRAFGEAEKCLLRSLRPHLERALALHVRIKLNDCGRRILAQTLDRLAIGVFILDPQGRVMSCNSVAREQTKAGSGIRLVEQKLHLLRERDNGQLARLIDGASATAAAGAKDIFAEAMRIDCPVSGNFGLLVRSLIVPEGQASDTGPSVVVYVSAAPGEALPMERMVAKLFALTPSEARLATLLANGLTLSEAASELEITEQSVRSYTKSLYRKVGVTRQTDLVRLVLRSVAVLA